MYVAAVAPIPATIVQKILADDCLVLEVGAVTSILILCSSIYLSGITFSLFG